MRVAIIPARGGSKRIPRKNIRPFHGKPILAYSIAAAKQAGLFDRIFVSTEDDEISKVAPMWGAEVLPRSAKMAANHVGTQEVMADALRTAHEMLGQQIDFACCIYATAPLISPADLQRGFRSIYKRTPAGYAFSVGTEPLADAGQFYFGDYLAFVSGRPLYDESSVMIPVESRRVCDINTFEDWFRAEAMYGALPAKQRLALPG